MGRMKDDEEIRQYLEGVGQDWITNWVKGNRGIELLSKLLPGSQVESCVTHRLGEYSKMKGAQEQSCGGIWKMLGE